MRKVFRLLLAVVLVPWVVPAAAATPVTTLAATPPMGFNNWNAFGCDVTESLIEETADKLVSAGLKDLGYQYVNIDDCWSLRERGSDGRLVPDPAKFPSGIKGVADYVHAKGLKLGIYGDAGTKTCAGFPGSLGHEDVDAQTWADWGVDYLKYDNCNNASDGSQADYIRRYTAMRDALNRTGRRIVYAICEWGTSQPWLWGKGVGQLWRTTGDVNDEWPSLRSIIEKNVPLAPYAGPGHWNDPDMMEIGNGGMTDIEYRTHMSMWAVMAAPLLIGTDIRTASPATMAILGNREIIAVDQDRLGVQGAVVSDENGLMVLDKPLADGDRAIALYNSTDALATVSVPAAETGLRHAGAYRLRDLWTGDVLQARDTIAAAVPAHGTVVYRVRPLRDPARVAPSVTVGATLGTLVPGEDATLSTTVTNRGAGTIRNVELSVRAPDGWTVTGTSTRRALPTNATVDATWTVTAPPGTPAGRYPIALTATYTWGRLRGTSTSAVVGTLVNAPPDGRRYLSTLEPVRVGNGLGPIGTDLSNGGSATGDGSLITIAGRVYQRGIGTTAASDVLYYLGGRCTNLTTDVGMDDEATATGPATFTVNADDTAVADAVVNPGDPAVSLTADLTGVSWLRLTTTAAANEHTDWAAAALACGPATSDDPVEPVDRTLFSFETGTDDFTIANPGDGGTVTQSTAFHTDGEHGLRVSTPLGGNWYGARVAAPLDLTGTSSLKVDVRGGPAAGTTGELAVQTGPGSSWCQGSRWAWVDTATSRTISVTYEELDCPAGVTFDPAEVHAVWVFLNGGEAYLDDVRAE
jgi:alpha-galactosidase